jgi:hypothetical protein
LPPPKHRGFLAYVGSEVTFWIVAALVGGAVSSAANSRYDLSYVFGGIAALFVFIWLFRAGERAKRGPGLLYCAKCKYYCSPERIESESGMPYVEVEIQFSSTSDGGRTSPVILCELYRPHFRVVAGEMLGVQFMDGPDEPIAPGEASCATVRFVYWPNVNYDALVEGAAFDVVEGATVVGHGRVIQHLK